MKMILIQFKIFLMKNYKFKKKKEFKISKVENSKLKIYQEN